MRIFFAAIVIITSLLSFEIAAVALYPQGQIHLQSQANHHEEAQLDKGVCPLALKIKAPNDGLHPPLDFITDDAVRALQVERLSKAVRIPTVVTDDMNDPYDSRFDSFIQFHTLLRKLFPISHSYAQLEHVNRLGLVYTFNGTSKTLKPIMLTAHQDVVPTDDPSDWTYPPFKGYFDGKWMWGRGAVDCKNNLIGLLSVMEDLISQGWTPKRTVVLAFGYDEESGGLGAASIAEFLEERYGHYGFELILDEGGMGLETIGDIVYALPGVGEKGAVDFHLALSVKGGHSSVPPSHTGIGIISEIIYELERQDLFFPRLGKEHPTRRTLECQTRYSPDFVEPWLASALASDDFTGVAEAIARSRGITDRFKFQTSQAVDVIGGGVKVNALPEKIFTNVNYRVALHETVGMLRDRAVKIISPIVAKYNLTFSAFEDGVSDEPVNHLAMSVLAHSLEVAPVSPTDVHNNHTWARFSGVARSVFESVPSLKGKTVVVSGDIMTGNTDTSRYWNLTQNIYRWSPSRTGTRVNAHTVNERLDMQTHVEVMMFYYGI
ncbi:MAG: hypothetical protein M1834_005497 [Cirrosporium novae-zelandiae]|nr:MAG: hypothetical protein M1834_005497 [Cirrosporium novae-zelandiae]